jgi:hypothetical protein
MQLVWVPQVTACIPLWDPDLEEYSPVDIPYKVLVSFNVSAEVDDTRDSSWPPNGMGPINAYQQI